MGKVLNDLGDLPKAIDAYERAVDLDPENRDALIGLIGCLISNSQTDLAQPWVTKALAKDPDDPKVLGFAVRCAFDANRLDEAIAAADRASAGIPRTSTP